MRIWLLSSSAILYASSFLLPALSDKGATIPGWAAFLYTWFLGPVGWIPGLANFGYLIAGVAIACRRKAVALSSAVAAIACSAFGLMSLIGLGVKPSVGFYMWVGSMALLMAAVVLEKEWAPES